MKKIRRRRNAQFAIVHGVNTPPDSDWAEDFSELAGIFNANLHPINWPSSSFVGDGLKWLASPRYRRDVVHKTVEQLTAIKHIDAIVTHSFGQIVINAALAEMDHTLSRPACPVINLAGPLSHPIFSRLYGRWGCDHHDQIHVRNPDDHITAAFGHSVDVPGAEVFTIRVDVKGDEHPIEHYLESLRVQTLIGEAIGRRPYPR